MSERTSDLSPAASSTPASPRPSPLRAEPAPASAPSRRRFLKASASASVAAAAAAMGSPLPLERSAHAAGSDAIRIGLIGCGGRGTKAAINAMNAGKDVRLVALAELFAEHLDESLAELTKARPDQVDVPPHRRFLGFDAYRQLIASGVDVVLIAAASHFHPRMLRDSVDAGKHVFCEKPHGIDVPGVQASLAASEEARRRGLCLVSGLCWRYDPGVRETVRRVRDGAIGDVVAIQETYVSAPYGIRERRAGWSEMEYQLRNWYHFNWLSGDQTSQQLIHSLDKASWVLGDVPPLKVWGLGGRQVCIEERYGDQYDHHAVVFEYPSGVRVFGFTRDMPDCYRETSDIVFGTKGRASLMEGRIDGETRWSYGGPKGGMYDIEHAELFAAIRRGEAVNDGRSMCLSSLLAVASQVACYTGQLIGWDELLGSKRTFALERYGLDVEPPVRRGPDGVYPSAMPGKDELARWRIG